MRMTQSLSSALKWEKNGFAAAPPAWSWRIGVSTSTKPLSQRYLRISMMSRERVKKRSRLSSFVIRST